MAAVRLKYLHVEKEVAGATAGIARSKFCRPVLLAHLVDRDLLRSEKHHTLLARPVPGQFTVEVAVVILIVQIDLPGLAYLLCAGTGLQQHDEREDEAELHCARLYLNFGRSIPGLTNFNGKDFTAELGWCKE